MNPARYIIRFILTRLFRWVGRGIGLRRGAYVAVFYAVVGNEIRGRKSNSKKARPTRKPSSYG